LRLEGKGKLADHDLTNGIGEHDHHPRGQSFRVLINNQSIPGSSAYEHRVSLGREGHKTIRAVLRGNQNVDIQGHTGCVLIGTDTSQECTGFSIKPYGGSGYPISYMGCYSRLHGDSYLTPALFGGLVRMRDIYIDGDEAVLEFYNVSGFTRFFNCYGMVEVK